MPDSHATVANFLQLLFEAGGGRLVATDVTVYEGHTWVYAHPEKDPISKKQLCIYITVMS